METLAGLGALIWAALLISPLIFGLIARDIATDFKSSGFFWGFFLGPLGIIIVLLKVVAYNSERIKIHLKK